MLSVNIRRQNPLHETQANRRHGLHGRRAHRRRHLAAHPLHRRPAAARTRRLLHRRFRPLPYNPQTFEASNDFDYAAASPGAAGAANSASNVAGVFAPAIFPAIRPPVCALTKIRQLYREADAILNVCGTQEFNDDLLQERSHPLHRERPRRGADQGRPGHPIDARLSRRSITLFSPLAKTSGPTAFPCPLHDLELAPDPPTGRDRSLENRSALPPPTAVFTSIANWSTSGLKDIDGAAKNISGANRANFSASSPRRKDPASRSNSRPTSRTTRRAKNSSGTAGASARRTR